MRLLLIAAVIAGLAWWLLRPRRRPPGRAARADTPRGGADQYAIVNGHIVRRGQRQGVPYVIYGLSCSICGPIGTATDQPTAEWACSEHLRLNHSGRR